MGILTYNVEVKRGENVSLDILAENMGRVNYGAHIRDQKGINGVRFDGQYHFGWDPYRLPMVDELDKLQAHVSARNTPYRWRAR